MSDTNSIITLTEPNLIGMIGNYIWLFLVGVIGVIFKSSIEKFVCAVFVFFGNDYNEDDIVYINGQPGRIIRIGLTKTTFFIYDVQDGKIVGGKKLVVQNEKLNDLNIEKPLENVDLTQLKK